MDTDGSQPIETAPAETTILMCRIEAGQLKQVGMGRISKPQDGKPIAYQWIFTIAPTHWKPAR
jgi:hypothetical protein